MKGISKFLCIFSWFSLRHLKKNRWRIVAVIAGIAIGSAVFTSVRVAVDASLQSFQNSMDLLSGGADCSVICPGGMVPDKYVSQLIRCPMVKSISPVSTAYVSILSTPSAKKPDSPDEIKKNPVLLVGVDPILDRDFHHWKVARSGNRSWQAWIDLIKEPFIIILSSKLAQAYHVKKGYIITVEHGSRLRKFKIAGILSPEGLDLAEGGLVAITDIATMQEFTGTTGLVEKIDLKLETPNRDEAILELRRLLPPDLCLALPGEAKESGNRLIRSYQLNLSVLSFVSLFVGMFLVYSLVSLNAASRRHELSVLRSIGTSRHCIFLLFMGEGLVLGLAGWLLSVPISTILVVKLISIVSRTISNLFVRVQVSTLHLSAGEVLFSFFITVGVSLIAAYHPALQAMKVSPKEALAGGVHFFKRKKDVQKLGIIGLVMVSAVSFLSLVPPQKGVPLPGYVATFCLFCGFSLITPYLFHVLGTFVPDLLRKVAGIPAYLAGRYLKDAENRVAISVGALITAVALFVGIVVMVHSFRMTMREWVRESISGDIFVRPKMADLNLYRYPLPEQIVTKLKNLGNEVDLLPYERAYLHYGKVQYQFEAIDLMSLKRHVKWIFLKGNMRGIFPGLLGGHGVVVSEVFSNTTGLNVGDMFLAEIKGVLIKAPILGIIRDYRTRGGIVYYSLRSFERLCPGSAWNGVRLFFADRKNVGRKIAALREKLINCCPEARGVSITPGRTLRRNILRIFEETFAITTVLLIVSLTVASLSTATTLSVLILERRVQLSTLVAIGASKKQIRSMIIWESVWMVIAGEAMGTLCGLALSYLLIFVINKQSFGWTFVPSINWWTLVLSFPLILATALVAAIPAIKMALNIRPALVLKGYHETL